MAEVRECVEPWKRHISEVFLLGGLKDLRVVVNARSVGLIFDVAIEGSEQEESVVLALSYPAHPWECAVWEETQFKNHIRMTMRSHHVIRGGTKYTEACIK